VTSFFGTGEKADFVFLEKQPEAAVNFFKVYAKTGSLQPAVKNTAPFL